MSKILKVFVALQLIACFIFSVAAISFYGDLSGLCDAVPANIESEVNAVDDSKKITSFHPVSIEEYIEKQDDVNVSWVYDYSISAEENIYNYLTIELNLPSAAACGILGNIAYETGWTFNPDIGNEAGCYGLVQWLGGRLSNMISWCRENGMDYSSIEGQLSFIVWEMRHDDPYGTYDFLIECEDSTSGAYDAGWYFCYWYERPYDKDAQSRYRGNEASKYFGLFADK